MPEFMTQFPAFPARPGKYPSEDEPYVRRLGIALMDHWYELPAELRDQIEADALKVWDREYHVHQLAQKLEAFIKRRARRNAPVSS